MTSSWNPARPLARRAVALLSGGLDSALAVRVVQQQGIEVIGLRFMTHFGCDAGGSGSCGHDVTGLSRELGIEVKLCHLGEPYVAMVRQPKFGRGANMNPCVDCRIFMLSWACEYAEQAGASFFITGEVLDQRPLSQTRGRFPIIDREAGLEGYVLRPLSARHLPATVPEREGVVDRSRLLALRGRSRRPQYELARRYGITDFGQPAGGCLLTDPGYSARLKDLWEHDPDAGVPELQLLRVGRHFRLSAHSKAIVGRDRTENVQIEALARDRDLLLMLRDHMGPTTLVHGEDALDHVGGAAAITVRYGDTPGPEAWVVVRRVGGPRWEVHARAATEEELARMRIGARPAGELPVGSAGR